MRMSRGEPERRRRIRRVWDWEEWSGEVLRREPLQTGTRDKSVDQGAEQIDAAQVRRKFLVISRREAHVPFLAR